jgi:hypothetical protein
MRVRVSFTDGYPGNVSESSQAPMDYLAFCDFGRAQLLENQVIHPWADLDCG